MLCPLIRFAHKIDRIVTRAVHATLDWLGTRLRRLWIEHLDNVANNAAYATAAGAIVGGLLGFLPVRDVMAAVLAAAVHVYVTGVRPSGSSMNRWTDQWDGGDGIYN